MQNEVSLNKWINDTLIFNGHKKIVLAIVRVYFSSVIQ